MDNYEVHAWLDEATCEKSRQVSNSDTASVRIQQNKFHGAWNDQILPRNKYYLMISVSNS